MWLNEKLQITLICLVIGVAIMFYGSYRCENPDFEDPLINGKKTCRICDGWSISHFLLYLVFGYFYPNEVVFAFILGVIWELFEYLISMDNENIRIPGIYELKKLSKCKTSVELTDKRQHWIYYEITDIFMNFAGLALGYSLSKRLLF